MFNTMKLQAVSIFTVGALALTLGYGYVQVQSQSAPMFTQSGKTLTVASSTTLVTERLVTGGGIIATSTPTSSVLPYSYFDTESQIDLTLTQGAGTLTTGVSSTVTGIPVAGQTMEFKIRHATTTASINLTLACGTGFKCKSSTATSTALFVLPSDTDGYNFFNVKLTRQANTDILLEATRGVD